MSSCSVILLAVAAVLAVTQHVSASELRGVQYQRRQLNVETLGVTLNRTECPEVMPVSDFDLERYIEASWFVQKQQVNAFQSEDQLFCVTTTFNRSEEADNLTYIENYANEGAVNGPQQNSSEFTDMCARQLEEETGEFAVAPCVFLDFNASQFDQIAGPYWVLALDTENYEWAIVSGGQPSVVMQEEPEVLCTTNANSSDINGSGLWLYTREQVASNETIATMEERLVDMGIYNGSLKTVIQEGCEYEGAFLK